MPYKEFLAAVRARGPYEDLEEAARVTEAVLSTLGARLQSAVAEHLADQLPMEVGDALTDVGDRGRTWGVEELVRQVAVASGDDREEARAHAEAVLTVLGETVSGGELNKIISRLPADAPNSSATPNWPDRTGIGGPCCWKKWAVSWKKLVSMISELVQVPAEGATLPGDLVVPDQGRALVLFAHGSGSSRHSPRNRWVASELRTAGLGTLLIDLLTEEEERRDSWTAEHRFDIPLLGRRLVGTIDWLAGQPDTRDLPVVLFGASTGAGAALVAAAERPDRVLTVVSRGGRPDLADDALEAVRAPVLLIVGGEDTQVLRLNEEAGRRLNAPHALRVVPGATHLFEEPGALEQVAEATREWCDEHL